MISTPGTTISQQCLTDAIDDETVGPWVDVRGRANIVFYQSSTGTTSGGVITFEEAAPKNCAVDATTNGVFGAATGDYASITTSNASDTSAAKQKSVHLDAKGYCFVRARVSTAIIGGGSVSVCCIAY